MFWNSRGHGLTPARSMIFVRVVRRFAPELLNSGTTASHPSSARSNNESRMSRNSGAIGTTRTACP